MRAYRRIAPAVAFALAAGLAACADQEPTAVAAPAAPAFAKVASSGTTTTTGSTTTISGDTTIVTFTVGTNAMAPATIGIGNGHKIDFPYASSSICDVRSSSYGATEWDKPCLPSPVAVTITARSWINAQGLPQTDFQPAMRFVPGLKKPVLLSLKDKEQKYTAGQQVLFCTAAGCVDESIGDPSVRTTYDATNSYWQRPVKHFSGYTLSIGRSYSY